MAVDEEDEMASLMRRTMEFLGLVDEEQDVRGYDELGPGAEPDDDGRARGRAPGREQADLGASSGAGAGAGSGVGATSMRMVGRETLDRDPASDEGVTITGRSLRTAPAPQTAGRPGLTGPAQASPPPPGASGVTAATVTTAAATPKPKVHVVEPADFPDAQEIGDSLKASQPVIVSLQTADADLSRRLIDFCSGATYVLGGSMERVARNVFLLTPSNVEVSAEEKQRLSERGLYRA